MPMIGPARVLLIGLDGFPVRAIRPDLTPRSWELGEEGGRAVDGGRSELPSTTYPSFVTLLTGASPERHGVRTTFAKPGAVPGWAGERVSRVPTLLHACEEAGVPARAILGDHLLHGVLGLADADAPWPVGGQVADGVPRDAHGYPTDEAVAAAQREAIADREARLVFLHLNESDTVGHDDGPESDSARACYARTDRQVGGYLDALRGSWAEWVVIVVSDHDMVPRASEVGLDPMSLPGVPELADDWIGDGGCAWLHLRPDVRDGHVADVLGRLDEVAAWRVHGDRLLLLSGPGRAWHAGPIPLRGLHGGLDAVRTVAIVGGGHPAIDALARSIAGRPPRLRDWAPTIAGLLGIDLPDATGIDLLGPDATTDAVAVDGAGASWSEPVAQSHA
jgi:arylsulfatase A-like enzyme